MVILDHTKGIGQVVIHLDGLALLAALRQVRRRCRPRRLRNQSWPSPEFYIFVSNARFFSLENELFLHYAK